MSNGFEGVRCDGSRPDGSRRDGSRRDGSRRDGSRPDGSRPEEYREPPLAFFTRGVLHELRNQLTVLMNSSYSLGRSLDGEIGLDPRRQAEVLERATIEVEGASGLLEAYADYIATPSSRVEGTDLGLVTERLRRLVSHTFMRLGVGLEFGPTPSGLVAIDGGTLRAVLLQALGVLVLAVEGTRRRVTLGLFEEDNDLRARVAVERGDEPTGEHRGREVLGRLSEDPGLIAARGALESCGGRLVYGVNDGEGDVITFLDFFFPRTDRSAVPRQRAGEGR